MSRSCGDRECPLVWALRHGLAQIVGLADRAPGQLSCKPMQPIVGPAAIALVVDPCSSRQPVRCKIAILSPSLRWLSR